MRYGAYFVTCGVYSSPPLNTLKQRPENCCISIQISLKIVPSGRINNIPVLGEITASHQKDSI